MVTLDKYSNPTRHSPCARITRESHLIFTPPSVRVPVSACRWCSRSAGTRSAGAWWPLWRRSSAAWYVTPIHPPLIYAPLSLFFSLPVAALEFIECFWSLELSSLRLLALYPCPIVLQLISCPCTLSVSQVGLNAYLTPKGTQGLAPHHDEVRQPTH